jgi:NADH dehydrogenase
VKVLLTGATGFVGNEIAGRLLEAGHEVTALVRPVSGPRTGAIPQGVAVASGDVQGPDLEKHLAGADAVIHLAGIIREFPARGVTFLQSHVEATRNVDRAMKAAGVKRLVHMSALGASPQASTGYFRTKFEAEKLVQDSGLDWTVFKPSIIFGPRDQFVNLLARQVSLAPVIPVIGDGEYRLQPVSVHDVAQGFVQALTKPETIGQTYEVGGPRQMTYNQLLDAIGAALGKNTVAKIHVPLGLMKPMIGALERFAFFPITRGQLEMLLMNNVCDPGAFFMDFGLEPISFEEGVREYVGKR